MSEETKAPKSNSYDGKVIIDSLGRSITLRKPKMTDEFCLKKALGEDSTNEGLLQLCMPILFVAKINNDVMPTAVTIQDVKANINRLEKEGCNAVWIAVIETMQQEQKEVEANVKK